MQCGIIELRETHWLFLEINFGFLLWTLLLLFFPAHVSVEPVIIGRVNNTFTPNIEVCVENT